MKKVIESLPTAKQVVVTLVVSYLVGALVTGGFHPKAFLGLLIGVLFLCMITLRNYDPDAYEAHSNPQAYSLRHERDDLFRALKQVVKTVEEDPTIGPHSTVGRAAAEGKQTIAAIEGKYARRR